MTKIFKIVVIIAISIIIGFAIGRFSANGFKSKTELSNYAEIMAYGKLKEDKILEAIQYFSVSKHYNPNNMAPYIGLGTIFYNFKLYKLSLVEFSGAIDKEYTNFLFYGEKIEEFSKRSRSFVYCYLADIYNKLSRKKESLNNYKLAVEEYPQLPEYLTASIKTKTEKKSVTKKEFEKTLLFLNFLKGLNSAGVLSQNISNQIIQLEANLIKKKQE